MWEKDDVRQQCEGKGKFGAGNRDKRHKRGGRQKTC